MDFKENKKEGKITSSLVFRSNSLEEMVHCTRQTLPPSFLRTSFNKLNRLLKHLSLS